MNKLQYFENNAELHKTITETQDIKTTLWLENVLFSPQWWIGICLSIFPWVLWLLLSKSESRNRLLYSAFSVLFLASFLDFLGTQLGLWLYNYEVFPLMPAYLPWDWTLIPVTVIGLIEFKPHFSPFLKAIIFAFLSSFVGGILFESYDFFKRIHWEHYYSFPIYFLLFYIGYWASLRKQFASYKD